MTRRPESGSPDPQIWRSVVGCDAGLVTFGLAHVARREFVPPGAQPFELKLGQLPLVPSTGVYLAREPDQTARETVAERTAHRVHELSDFLRPRLAAAVCAGAELVAAERYEHVRESAAAAKAAAGHAALVLDCARLDPRPHAQRHGCGCPEYRSARDVKRAVSGCDVAGKRVVRRAVERLVAGARDRLASMRVADAAHLADASAVALCALGHRERVLVIGEYQALAAIGGREARRRCLLCKGTGRVCEADAVEASGTVVNPRPALCFCAGTPVIAGFDVRKRPDPGQLDGRAVLVVGAAARQDLKLAAGPPLVWREERKGEERFMAALLPGPADRFWRNEASARKARLFLRSVARPT